MQEIRCVNNKWLNDEKWLKESGIVISDRRRHSKKTTEERKSRLKGWLIINDDKEVVQINVFFSSKPCHGWNEKYPPKDLVFEDLFPDCGLCFEGSGSSRNWRLGGSFAWIFKLLFVVFKFFDSFYNCVLIIAKLFS